MRVIVIFVILLNVPFGILAQNQPTLDIVPNPFMDTTSFVFSLPTSDTVSLVVYDRWGQLIDSVINEQFMSQGTHDVIFVGDTLPEDVYYVALIVDANVVPKSLVKLNQLVGVKDYRLEEQRITIYPNPTTRKIRLINLPERYEVRITICSILGELVYDQLLTDPQINISELSAGVYFLAAHINGKIQMTKISKN